jgi:hypothetical protein
MIAHIQCQRRHSCLAPVVGTRVGGAVDDTDTVGDEEDEVGVETVGSAVEAKSSVLYEVSYGRSTEHIVSRCGSQ